jgi:hypothetical protein
VVEKKLLTAGNRSGIGAEIAEKWRYTLKKNIRINIGPMVSTAEKNIKQTKKFFFDILNYNFLKPIIAKRTTFPF